SSRYRDKAISWLRMLSFANFFQTLKRFWPHLFKHLLVLTSGFHVDLQQGSSSQIHEAVVFSSTVKCCCFGPLSDFFAIVIETQVLDRDVLVGDTVGYPGYHAALLSIFAWTQKENLGTFGPIALEVRSGMKCFRPVPVGLIPQHDVKHLGDGRVDFDLKVHRIVLKALHVFFDIVKDRLPALPLQLLGVRLLGVESHRHECTFSPVVKFHFRFSAVTHDIADKFVGAYFVAYYFKVTTHRTVFGFHAIGEASAGFQLVFGRWGMTVRRGAVPL